MLAANLEMRHWQTLGVAVKATVGKCRAVFVVEYSRINRPKCGGAPQDLVMLCERWGRHVCRYDLRRDALVEIEPDFWRTEFGNILVLPVERQ